MKTSVMTAGKIYEEVSRMRKELDEINKALDLVEEEIGINNTAYKLLDNQKTDKFKELQEFERKIFTLGNHQEVKLNDFWADTPASKPF